MKLMDINREHLGISTPRLEMKLMEQMRTKPRQESLVLWFETISTLEGEHNDDRPYPWLPRPTVPYIIPLDLVSPQPIHGYEPINSVKNDLIDSLVPTKDSAFCMVWVVLLSHHLGPHVSLTHSWGTSESPLYHPLTLSCLSLCLSCSRTMKKNGRDEKRRRGKKSNVSKGKAEM